jgi:hypothetical protein
VWNNIIERMERKLQDEEKKYLSKEGRLLSKVN